MKIASLLGCLSGHCNISLFDLAEPSIYKLVCVKLFFWQNWEDTWFSLDSSLCNSKHLSVLLDGKRGLGSRLKNAAVIHKMLKGLCSQGSWDHKFFFNFSFFHCSSLGMNPVQGTHEMWARCSQPCLLFQSCLHWPTEAAARQPLGVCWWDQHEGVTFAELSKSLGRQHNSGPILKQKLEMQ